MEKSAFIFFIMSQFTKFFRRKVSTKYKIGISKKQFGLALNTKKKFVVTFLLYENHINHTLHGKSFLISF